MNASRIKILLAENTAILTLIALIAVLSILSPRFLSVNNGLTVLQQVAEIGLIALPLAFLVMSGSIDLSVGAVASLGAVTSALVATSTDSLWLGIAVGLAVGVLTGTINGLLVAFAGLNPLVVTMGFMSVWGGVALFLTNGKTVTGLPADARALSSFHLGPLSFQMIILIVAGLLAWYVLNKRPFGRQVLATGGNAKAAYLMGVNVRWVHLRLFIVTGVCAALAGILVSMKLQAAAPTLGSGMEFNALTVVLLGGVAFEGGKGKISGVIAGLLFVGALRNGLVILGVSQFLQTVFVGLTLVLAISLDKTIQQVLKRAWTTLVKSGPADAAEPTAVSK